MQNKNRVWVDVIYDQEMARRAQVGPQKLERERMAFCVRVFLPGDFTGLLPKGYKMGEDEAVVGRQIS